LSTLTVVQYPKITFESDQYALLCELRKELQARGLIGYYNDVAHLREQVQLHLTSVVSALLGQEEPGPSVEVLTAPRPDVRVSSAVAFAVYGGEPVPMLSISISNLSPVSVFISGVRIGLKDGQELLPREDSATGEPNSRRKLESGDSFGFYILPSEVRAVVDPSMMRRVVIRDAVGREYYSDEEAFQKRVSLVFSKAEET
jgi:hypothetical protein